MNFVVILAVITAAVIAFSISVRAGLVVSVAALAYIAYKAFPIFMALSGKKAYAAGDYERACRAYERALKKKNVNAVIRLEYADLLMQMGKTEKAKDFIDEMLLRGMPQNTANVLRLRRCMAYYKLGNTKEALEDASEIYKDGFRSTYMYAVLGLFKLELCGKSEDTFDFCREAYEYNEDDRDITDNYALALYYRGEYERACGMYNVMTKKYPEFVEGYYHGALAEYSLGNFEKAAKYLEKTDECKWSPMTTVTEEEIKSLKSSVTKKRE